MKKRYLLVLVSLIILTAGCNTQGLMKSKDLQNATQNMAKNESLQKAFSDGRIHVMHNLVETKRSILQNTLHEQHMMIDDPKLSQQLLALNINLNQMMMSSSSGKEQLTQSTLQIMDGINKDLSRLRSFIQIQNDSRKKALKDENLRNQILRQNVQEQYLALNHPTASRDMKEISIRTTNAILNDKRLKTSMLKQNVEAFRAISMSPSLRSQMADAMLPLLKDPKIAKELENMIKMAVAKEAQKLESKMQKLQNKQQLQNMQKTQKTEPPQVAPEQTKQQKDISSKKNETTENE
jgi:hypothetical protein